MIGIEVTVRGARVCKAGLSDGILLAELSGATKPADPTECFGLVVGGFAVDGSVEWVRETLGIGDVVTFEIMEVPMSDAPSVVLHDPDAEAFALQDRELQTARRYHSLLKHRVEELERQWGDRLTVEHGAA
jgi:hypothetical protein